MMEKKTVFINIWSGCGVGKSTSVASIYAHMKKLGLSVETVKEFATEVTFAEHFNIFGDQAYVLGVQHHRQFILHNKVDYVLVDSPLPLPCVYNRINNNGKLDKVFEDYALQLFNNSNIENVNFFLERAVPYNNVGRYQTYEQACELDNDVLNFMKEKEIPYISCANPDVLFSQVMKMVQIHEERNKNRTS